MLTTGYDLITSPAQQTDLAQAMAHGQAVSFIVLAFVFWRASKEAAPNKPVIVGAAIFLILRVVTDLYDLLVLTKSMHGLISLADLVLCVGMSVGIIESMPRVFGAVGGNEKGRGS